MNTVGNLYAGTKMEGKGGEGGKGIILDVFADLWDRKDEQEKPSLNINLWDSIWIFCDFS